MSYPEPLYLKEEGEVSATYRPGDHSPELVYANGTTIHYLATGATSAGGFGLYRYEMTSARSGPAPHFHRTISESFYTLTGSIRIHDGERWIDTQAGDFVHVPAGGIHGFRNESDAPASMLIHFAPGAPREAYFEDLVHLAEKSQHEVVEFMRYHDTYWL
ncbi:cupin domain-containing protein [Actinocrispum wychmicini]|uniref:Cupin domain n=1 Tax=Actinocrispum wychmicini TaxID=1213861 RepID=A0A4R2K8G8_9PSEU|nr:cupin domain-containing protein [Actinocrispum wychmicini]TCO62675.1 cupin domain [Actinocrispum wychmicini]